MTREDNTKLGLGRFEGATENIIAEERALMDVTFFSWIEPRHPSQKCECMSNKMGGNKGFFLLFLTIGEDACRQRTLRVGFQ